MQAGRHAHTHTHTSYKKADHDRLLNAEVLCWRDVASCLSIDPS